MPIFNNEITFIHIPKSGGTSVERFMEKKGFKMSLFTSTGSVYINGHSPQHCTFRELTELNLLTDKIFTIIRDEKERVLSEYFYILSYRPDLRKIINSFDDFLDLFLDKENALLFDNHNLSNHEFLINHEGNIDPRITIFSFFDYRKIEDFLGIKGLNEYHEMKYRKNNFLTTEQIRRINAFYGL